MLGGEAGGAVEQCAFSDDRRVIVPNLTPLCVSRGVCVCVCVGVCVGLGVCVCAAITVCVGVRQGN